MIAKTIISFALLTATLAFPPRGRSQHGDEAAYNGAVVEYRPYNDWTHGGERILQENAQTIAEFASKAKIYEADIFVLPEYGLTGGYIGMTDDEVNSICQFVPDPEDNLIPCTEDINGHTYDALKHISCTARDLQLYMVVDLIEKINPTDTENRKFFNTQVVFDRNGKVIARYRKKNLFFEPMLTPGTDDYSTAVFTTDFGVTFALQVCFDILHDDPAFNNVINHNITDIVMSTYWYDGLPFLTAPQAFSSWATGLGVNLLVSSYHNPQRGSMGFGIFTGIRKQHSYVFNKNINSALIVRTIHPVNGPDKLVNGKEDIPASSNEVDHVDQVFPEGTGEIFHFFIHENLENYTTKILPVSDSLWKIEEQCDNDVCCTAKYSYSEELPNGETYQLMAFDGIIGTDAGEYQIRVQTCGVVHCLSSSIDSCANINDPYTLNTSFRLKSLRGAFASEYVYPSVFTADFKLVNKFLFKNQNMLGSTEAGMLLGKPVDNLLSATLFSRYYSEDP